MGRKWGRKIHLRVGTLMGWTARGDEKHSNTPLPSNSVRIKLQDARRLILFTLTVISFLPMVYGQTDIQTKKISTVRTMEAWKEGSLAYSPEDIRSAPDRILIKYIKQRDHNLQSLLKSSFESTYSLREIDYFSFIDVYLYQTSLDKEITIKELRKDHNIKYAEPDYFLLEDSRFPNDPYFNWQWGLHNTGKMDVDIDAPEAWEIETGNRNAIVAVMDPQGIDYTHDDLKRNMWKNPGEIPNNGIDDDKNGYIDDIYGMNADNNSGNPMATGNHGTMCAGVIAASGNNGIGISGVCWDARIMALKGSRVSESIKCFEYAIKKGAHIISISWFVFGQSHALYDAIEAARNANILCIVSAGNEGRNIDISHRSPASLDCENIITVTGIDKSDKLVYNYGPYSVDVAAPCEGILTTCSPRFPIDGAFEGKYSSGSGTSLAGPFVSGLAALIKSHNPRLNWQQIKAKILGGSIQIPALKSKILTGARINALNSLSFTSFSSYSLDVQSSPSSRAYIEVTPRDLNGKGNGYTKLTRKYSPYKKVTLTAPAIHGGRKFGHWSMEGSRYSTNRSISLSMDFNHKIEAIYSPYTIKVESSPPTNIHIEIDQKDENGQGSGYTNFTRYYQSGTQITLTAPAEYRGEKFVYWLKNSSIYDHNNKTGLTVDNNITLIAIYSKIFKWAYKVSKYSDPKIHFWGDICPAVDKQGTIYYQNFALNSDGTKKWEIPLSEWSTSSNSSSVIGLDGTIYIVGQLMVLNSGNGLRAVNPDGNIKWSFEVGDIIESTPALDKNGNIYFGCNNKYLYALDSEGQLKWKYKAGGPILSSPAIGSDGTIYFGGQDSYFYALNPAGTLKWKYRKNGDLSVFDYVSPALGADDTIYFGGGQNRSILYALTPSGTLKWKYDKLYWPVGSSPAIGRDGTIYFGTGSCDEMLVAIDTQGKLKWRFSENDLKKRGSVFSSPAIGSDGTIYFCSIPGYLYAIDPKGKIKWKFLTGNDIWYFSPTIGPDGTIYFCSGDGYLYALKSDSKGLANSSWPKFHQNRMNTGRNSSK